MPAFCCFLAAYLGAVRFSGSEDIQGGSTGYSLYRHGESGSDLHDHDGAGTR